jgi:hypothetical protein
VYHTPAGTGHTGRVAGVPPFGGRAANELGRWRYAAVDVVEQVYDSSASMCPRGRQADGRADGRTSETKGVDGAGDG